VFVLPATIPLVGEITDDLDPQFYHIEIYANGAEEPVYDSDNIKLELLIENPEAGEIELRVVITDEAGNQDEETIAFEILPKGSELPADDDLVLEDDPIEGCRVAPHHSPFALLLVGLLGLRRRRR
jgi:MYXO-CTERM domain-containing protein